MTDKKTKRLNRAQRTVALLRSGWGTALTVQRAFSCTTPSKWISEARAWARIKRLRWHEDKVKCDDGRWIKAYRVAS